MDRVRGAVPVAVGRYAMHGQIGAGGMATVHLGRAPGNASSTGSVVAIKRLRPHLASEPEVVKSFLDEARLSARVGHPNVVATLDVVTHEDEVFLVMEYVEGVSLASLMRAQAATPGSPAVPAPIATSILSGVLRGLHAAHEAVSETGEPLNMVHRDVSPHNILVGVDGKARVLDFGIAKALGRQQTTRDGKIKGKLGYMAPEQLSGRGATRRTDLFAAGIVLWELVTGKRLFHAEDEATTVTRVLMERVRPPSTVRAGVPAALDAVVLRALERDPSKRFLTGEEMACALEAAVPPATAASVGEWVATVAAEELAFRAGLLREETQTRVPFSSDGGEAGSTTRADRARAPRKLRALVAVSALVGVGVVGWGVASVTRGKVREAQAVAPPAPSPSMAEVPPAAPPASGALAPSPPVTPGEDAVPVASASVHPPSKTSVHHAPKPTPAKAAPSARERLYSRD
ncbi:MAG: protein kinase domain-containing protein [Polyangiaceae bacterium]